MQVHNTSRYSDAEVEELIAFGAHGINTDGVLFRVKNCTKSAYRGRTYSRIPSISPAAKMSGVTRLITIRIGVPGRFPADNMTRSTRWEKEKHPWAAPPQREGEDVTSRIYYRRQRGPDGRLRAEPDQIRFGRVVRHPYGGVRSPLIVLADWREAMVALAAHEARHHQQMQHKKPLSEVDAEKFAAKRLAAFRA